MTTSIKTDEDLTSHTQQLPNTQQHSVHCCIREVLPRLVAREVVRKSFKREALVSWNAYKETGEHLTGAEIRSWLKTWGTEEASDLPPFHD
ncbi:CopG family transcriptional regulator [Pseudomonas sp. OA65]|uniref:CopG family transcriptional regulator n=1 Tax=Pseudomonas sp. OA65 TaxID=2818431 RepID=UPI001A9FADCA|nr:CopG family transcriptional regulator [Pseudomonas sp. OA65]MBO1542030.1 CopG family transcriptional regulator [Pseudomonas sp. OA65]